MSYQCERCHCDHSERMTLGDVPVSVCLPCSRDYVVAANDGSSAIALAVSRYVLVDTRLRCVIQRGDEYCLTERLAERSKAYAALMAEVLAWLKEGRKP